MKREPNYHLHAMKTAVTSFKRNNAQIHCGITCAVEDALRYGCEADDHKQWLIDKLLHHMLGDAGYKEFVDRYNEIHEPNSWDTGLAPYPREEETQ